MHTKIRDILEHIKKEELRLIVETNGVLCTPELAGLMRECKNPFVSVSLDGADAEIHEWIRGVPGSFEGALQGIRNLVDAGFRPQIIMTIMKKNKHQIEDIVRLAEKLKAASVKFNIMQPAGRGEEMHKSEEDLSIEELVKLGEWIERDLSKSTDLRIHHSHPMAFKPLSRLFGDKGDGCSCCGIFGIIGVLGDGSYALCGIGETVPKLVFGNVEKDSLEDVWYNNGILKEIREGLPDRLEGVCRECLMKNICLGSCIAQNYFNNKNLWSAFWYCQNTYKKKLFPETRWSSTLNSGI
ncbi:MAG: Antilisterial bacteriocin subtilosin biosynthesis protein AlbA [bacterium ADurb.Bin363]|nr:MAG: Antilisterial bacteriocin subtilosin biosynthesis protein AlbA [bacterium ADurb.Bin363]